MKFNLGPSVKCDLQKLIDTRALIQANSGGGKSHTAEPAQGEKLYLSHFATCPDADQHRR